MHNEAFVKPMTGFILGLFIATQVLLIAAPLLIPKPAEAFPVVKIGDVYQALKDITIGIAKQMALRVAEKFLTKFVNKLKDKYKIRNYLYYDQILTNYILNNFIRDKIKDPDLQQIYALLESGYITGQSTGTTNGPNPNKALIPRLKKKISELYLKNGGVPSELISNPPVAMAASEYYSAAYVYHLNPPGYTESNLHGNYGSFQSSASTAAQLEVLVGKGLKAGRFIGGTCSVKTASGTGGTDPGSSPEACKAAGGSWEPSALDYARSFIDNPTEFVSDFMDAAIQIKISSSYDPNNFWARIGAALGNFLFNQLSLDKSGGVLMEDPRGYTPEASPPEGNGIDLDGDGIIDAYDVDADNKPDVCVFGGTAPACTGSKASTEEPPFDCATLPYGTEPPSLFDDVVAERAKYGDPVVGEDLGKLLNGVAWKNKDAGWGLSRKASGNNVSSPVGPIAIDILHHQPSNIIYDVLIAAGEASTPTWNCLGPMTDGTRPWVAPWDPGE